jgi:hypothetical protein
VDVQALLVVAFGPGHDVGGAQQSGIGDAGDRAAAAPIIYQRSREMVAAAGDPFSRNEAAHHRLEMLAGDELAERIIEPVFRAADRHFIDGPR